MRKIDYHMHTHFSGDSESSPREHIEQAIRMGLDEICFTDHRDFDYPIDTFDLDTDAYFMELSALKNEYVDRITIKIGVEVGLDTDHIDEINEFVSQCPLVLFMSFIIQNSIMENSSRVRLKKKHIENSLKKH